MLDRDAFYEKTRKFAELSRSADANGNLPPAAPRDDDGRFASAATPEEPSGVGSADQGAASTSGAGLAPPGNYERDLAEAERAGDAARVLSLKNQRTYELFQSANPDGTLPAA